MATNTEEEWLIVQTSSHSYQANLTMLQRYKMHKHTLEENTYLCKYT